MNKTVGGYVSKKDGTTLCVHCIDDQVQSRFIALSPASLNTHLQCSVCERSLIEALNSEPPIKSPEEDDQDELDLGMPEVFTPDTEEIPKPKPKRARKPRAKKAKKDGD